MKVLVFEPYASGHRLHYAALVSRAFADIGCDVVLATLGSSKLSKQYEIHAQPSSHLFRWQEIEESSSQLNQLQEVVAQIQPDRLIIPTASQFKRAYIGQVVLGRKFLPDDLASEFLFLGPGYGYPSASSKKWLSSKIQMFAERRLNLQTYAHIDPVQLAEISKGARQPERYRLMPDPAPEIPIIAKDFARESLAIPRDGKYIGCIGTINREKGVLDLLQAFTAATKHVGSENRLLLAGKFSEEITQAIDKEFSTLKKNDQLICIDRHLSEAEMNWAFQALDTYCAAHQGRPGSSGTVIRAANAGVPVLARDGFWTRYVVENFQLGWNFNAKSSQAFSQAIIKSFTAQYQPTEATRRFSQFHTEKNFLATWTINARRAQGLEPSPEVVNWSWVLEATNSNQPFSGQGVFSS